MNTNRFDCPDKRGDICIELTAAWVDASPFDACNNHVFELEFNTGEFIYYNLGTGITVHSYDPLGKTILRFTPPPLTSPHFYEKLCLEGQIQGPGQPNFTLRLFDPTGNSSYSKTQTFKLNDINEVGSSGTTTLLSSAIANNDLLTAASAANQGQRIRINGTLIINENYTFDRSHVNGLMNELYMAPGSKIIMQNDKTLNFNFSEIHGCGVQWNGVDVNKDSELGLEHTYLSDADIAIDLKNDTRLNLSRVFLSSNNIGIQSIGSQLKNIEINTNLEEFFTRISDGETGIKLENVRLVNLRGWVTFKNLNDGITLDHTNTFLGNHLTFKNCTNTGIDLIKGNTHFLLDNSSFTTGYTGIDGAANFYIVRNSDFDDLHHGIFRPSENANEDSNIRNIYTGDDCFIGVYGLPMASTATIENSRLRTEFINVIVQGFTPGNHEWAIQNNDWITDDGGDEGAGYNIYLSGTNNARIFNNQVVQGKTYNFFVAGGQYNDISFNEATSDFENISVRSSPGLILAENTLEGLNQSITIKDNCAGSYIACNTLSSTDDYFNLIYGSPSSTFAVSSPQYLLGNRFDPSEDVKSINFSPEDVAKRSQYIVGSNNTFQGSAGYPFFDSFFNDWFIREFVFQDENCETTPGRIEPEDQLLEIAKTNINLLDGGIDTIYNSEIEFDTKLKLYRALEEMVDQGDTLDTNQNSWYTSLQTGPFDEFIAFETIYEDAVAYTLAEQNQHTQLRGEIDTLIDEINSIEWTDTSANTGSPVIDPIQESIYQQKLIQLKQKTVSLNNLIVSKQTNLQAVIPQLNTTLNQISGLTTTSGQNLLDINQYLVQRIGSGFSGFSSSERNSIKQIADQCIGEGGEGVVRARGMLAEIDEQFATYNDDCISGQTPSRVIQEYNSTLQIATLFPNPAKDNITVTFPIDRTYQNIMILDMLGKVVETVNLKNDVSQLMIDVSTYPQGIYFISTDAEGNSKYKFTVIR